MTGTVTGIGGIFFRARDPMALAAWYKTHLGVPSAVDWRQAPGPAVFAPFRESTRYWPEGRQWMLNLRVEGLQTLIDRLQAAGIAVETHPDDRDTPELGRFARIEDPEGNNIELWEPPG